MPLNKETKPNQTVRYFYQRFLFFEVGELNCELNYHNQKTRRTLTHDILKHWTAVST